MEFDVHSYLSWVILFAIFFGMFLIVNSERKIL